MPWSNSSAAALPRSRFRHRGPLGARHPPELIAALLQDADRAHQGDPLDTATFQNKISEHRTPVISRSRHHTPPLTAADTHAATADHTAHRGVSPAWPLAEKRRLLTSARPPAEVAFVTPAWDLT